MKLIRIPHIWSKEVLYFIVLMYNVIRKEETFEDTRKRRILKGTAFRVCGGVKEV